MGEGWPTSELGWLEGWECPGRAIDRLLPFPDHSSSASCVFLTGTQTRREQRRARSFTPAGKGDHVTLSPSAFEAALKMAT